MNPSDELHGHDRRPGLLTRVVVSGFDDPRARLVTAAFVVASASHLWLADAWQPGWLLPDAIYLVGLIWLVVTRGAAAGWWLSAIGLAWPLLFLQDQLTQSVLLFVVAVVAGTTASVRMDVRRSEPLLATCRVMVVVTYFFAAFHKLNSSFLDSGISCATYGMAKLTTAYGIDAWEPSAFIVWSVILTELLLAGLAFARFHRLAWVVALAFHIPLTITMAPAFAFVMAVGWVGYASKADVTVLTATWRSQRGILGLVGGTLVAAVSLSAQAAASRWPGLDGALRETALWLALAVVVAAFALRGLLVRSPSGGRSRSTVVAAVAVAVVLVSTSAAPYFGVSFHHAGAMLSNLRIDGEGDDDCWNSVVVPRAMRLTDDYVRIDEAWLIEPGAMTYYENYLEGHLWSVPLLRHTRRNWCRPAVRPIYLEGTWRGTSFVIADLCADDWDQFAAGADGVFGVELFPEARRYQKFLRRSCRSACIH